MNNMSFSGFDDSILEPIRKAIYEAKRDYKNVLRIHVTNDFYMQVKAKCTPPFPDIQKSIKYPILGYEVIEHIEECETDWWLEIEGERLSVDGHPLVKHPSTASGKPPLFYQDEAEEHSH